MIVIICNLLFNKCLLIFSCHFGSMSQLYVSSSFISTCFHQVEDPGIIVRIGRSVCDAFLVQGYNLDKKDTTKICEGEIWKKMSWLRYASIEVMVWERRGDWGRDSKKHWSWGRIGLACECVSALRRCFEMYAIHPFRIMNDPHLPLRNTYY